MKTKHVPYVDGTHELEAFVAYHESEQPKPVVLIAHAWAGRDDFVQNKAQAIAELGYVGFALDMYGKGKLGNRIEENAALMQPLMDDRNLIKRRMHLALETARALPFVDEQRVVVIGFCFGGLCALDLARSGANVQGVVSFHGLFTPPHYGAESIHAKILVIHGDQDPMATPDNLRQFQDEMTAAGADWQSHVFGKTLHAFTNPQANDPELGTVYNRQADQRAWVLLQNFLDEVF